MPDSYRSHWSGMAFHSFLQRRFAPRKMVHLPSLRSRMTGKYLISFCKKLLFIFLLILAPSDGFAATLAKAKRLTHFCSVALLLEKWFACHHSFPYFFITLFPTTFYDRSRMTGKYLVPFCKKRFSFCSHYFHFLRFCSHLPLPTASPPP